MSDPVDVAKSNAWFAARSVAGGDREAASVVMRTAELTVIRRLLSAHLVGGEAKFWALVETELES